MMRSCYGFVVAVLAFSGGMQSAMAATTTSGKSAATTAAPKLTIYHIEGRRSERIVWFAEEIGLPYELVFVPGDLRASGAKIREVNPLMAIAPTVKYGDEIMVESAAILELLQERHANGRLAPAHTSPDYPKYLQWLHFAEGSAAPRFITEFLLTSVDGGKMSPVAQSQIGKSDQTLRYLEDFLTRHPYFGGAEFSIADIMMHFNLQFLELVVKKDLSAYPKLLEWQKNVEARPAFKKMRQVSLPNGHIGIPQSKPQSKE